MLSLLQKLQSALNKVNGNTMLIEDDRGYQEYYCTIGDHRVYEDQYNYRHSCCFKCWYAEAT